MQQEVPGKNAAGGAAPATRRSLSGGQVVVAQLVREGITHAFTVPGESFLGVLEGLAGPHREGTLRLVATRHEGGAAFMAEAFGQLTQRPAVCLGTRAVGAANLAIGIHTARQDSTPMLVLVGQVKRAWRGREAFQEVDQVGTFGRLAKWAVEVDDPLELAPTIHHAVAIARGGRPGPVLVSIPEDVLEERLDDPSFLEAADPGRPVPPREAVAAVLSRLLAARRPVVLAGGGVLRSGAAAELVAFAEAAELPVVAAWRRPDVFPNQHRLYLGMSGLGAAASVRLRLAEADAILAIGTRLSEIATFGYAIPARGTQLLRVDVDPGAHETWHDPAVAVRADARAFLELAIGELGDPEAPGDPARGERAARNALDREAYLAASALPVVPLGEGVHPAAVVAAMVEQLPDDAILTTDAGNFAGWAARYYRFSRPGTFLGPTSGAMGYGLPGAIAAALVHPGRRVVAMAGDGGFAMTMAELETAVREGLRLVALVFDNRMYGTIRMHQEDGAPDRVVGTDLGPIDFAAVATALGARGLRVDDDDEIPEALAEALDSEHPAVVHLRCDPRWLSVDRELGS